jgi:hypothetical protein
VSTVATASLVEIVNGLADQITDQVAAQDLGGEALQVWPYLVISPTPPCVDIYPADPFSEQTDYGPLRNRDFHLTVRARVKPVDVDASQQMLLQLMDPLAATSVHAAIISDDTIGGLVQEVSAEGPTGVIVYSPIGGEGYLVGCEWRTTVKR